MKERNRAGRLQGTSLIEPGKVKTISVMTKRLRPPASVVFAIVAVLAWPTASFAQIKVIISGGFSPAYRELLPEFEKTSGIKVTTTSGGSVGNGPNTIGGQIRRGVPADVVILAREGLRDLIAEQRIVAGTDVDLAQSIIGMVVRAGAPKPDISTVRSSRRCSARSPWLCRAAPAASI